MDQGLLIKSSTHHIDTSLGLVNESCVVMKYDCVAAASFKRGRSIGADRQFTCRLKTRVVIGGSAHCGVILLLAHSLQLLQLKAQTGNEATLTPAAAWRCGAHSVQPTRPPVVEPPALSCVRHVTAQVAYRIIVGLSFCVYQSQHVTEAVRSSLHRLTISNNSLYVL